MSETLILRSTFDYNLVSIEPVAHCNPKTGGELPTVEVLEVSTVELGKMHRVLGSIAFGFFRIIAAIAEVSRNLNQKLKSNKRHSLVVDRRLFKPT